MGIEIDGGRDLVPPPVRHVVLAQERIVLEQLVRVRGGEGGDHIRVMALQERLVVDIGGAVTGGMGVLHPAAGHGEGVH